MQPRFTPLSLPDLICIEPPRVEDARGWFSETFRPDLFRANVAEVDFVQENRSMSVAPGTVRGLHFQSDPHAQGKLVSCVAGALWDVAVDLRPGSPTYGRWDGMRLDADRGTMLWVPPGFAHGFCTLEPRTIISYRVTAPWNRGAERGIAWDDPTLAIDWPPLADPATLSEKDTTLPAFEAPK